MQGVACTVHSKASCLIELPLFAHAHISTHQHSNPTGETSVLFAGAVAESVNYVLLNHTYNSVLSIKLTHLYVVAGRLKKYLLNVACGIYNIRDKDRKILRIKILRKTHISLNYIITLTKFI